MLTSIPSLRVAAGEGHPTRIIWALVAIVVCLTAMAGLSIEMLSAARAYVSAESRWSKAQKDAVYQLARYARSRDEADFRRYREAIAITLGSRQARIELEKPDPDPDIVRRSFLQGGNHPEDIGGLTMLFRRFRRLNYVSDVIDIWVKADSTIEELEGAALRLRGELRGGASASRVNEILEDIHEINGRLGPLEDQFSAFHGEASRFVRRALLRTFLFAGPVLLLFGTMLVLRILKHDAQARKQRALRDSEEQLRAVLRNMPYPIGIARVRDGTMLYTNLRTREETKAPAQVQGEQRAPDFCVNAQDWWDMVRRALDEGFVRDCEVQMKDYEGRSFWTLISAQPLHFKDEPCVLTSFVNINERKQAEERLQFSASHDVLTGLPNRVMFGERLSQMLAQAQRHPRRIAVLFIDLDGFKEVNDTFGHDVGDALLREIAARLQSCLRKGDVVGRHGGDEFVVLIEEFDQPEQISVVARKIIRATAHPVVERGRECRVTASVGIALYPQDGEDVETLLRSADSAMYQAKVQGKNRFLFHSPAR